MLSTCQAYLTKKKFQDFEEKEFEISGPLNSRSSSSQNVLDMYTIHKNTSFIWSAMPLCFWRHVVVEVAYFLWRKKKTKKMVYYYQYQIWLIFVLKWCQLYLIDPILYVIFGWTTLYGNRNKGKLFRKIPICDKGSI